MRQKRTITGAAEEVLADQKNQLTQVAGQDRAVMLARTVTIRALERLIGPPGGRSVLDLACGNGKLSRWLTVHGAHVTSVDNSVESIEAARAREAAEPRGINYIVGNADDLYMIDDSAFDDVICHLAMDRYENIGPIVAEVSRIIKLGGRFIFSVGHPCFQQRFFTDPENCCVDVQSYSIEGPRNGLSGEIRHRTISTYINAVAARGFTVRRVIEPAADEKDAANNPELERWQYMPVALVVEAVFPHI